MLITWIGKRNRFEILNFFLLFKIHRVTEWCFLLIVWILIIIFGARVWFYCIHTFSLTFSIEISRFSTPGRHLIAVRTWSFISFWFVRTKLRYKLVNFTRNRFFLQKNTRCFKMLNVKLLMFTVNWSGSSHTLYCTTDLTVWNAPTTIKCECESWRLCWQYANSEMLFWISDAVYQFKKRRY